MRIKLLLAIAFPIIALAQNPAADPADQVRARLRSALSLRCIYTAEQDTKWTASGRTFPDEKVDPKDAGSKIVYDDINLSKGTARVIGNAGAGGVSVRLDGLGTLWIFERTPIGGSVMTTVFPLYAPGTRDFIVSEARTGFFRTSVLTQQSSGTCTVIG